VGGDDDLVDGVQLAATVVQLDSVRLAGDGADGGCLCRESNRISAVGPGAAGSEASRAASARMLPSATTSSGCSIATGASPSARCSSVATSGIRLAPPTRNTPASRPSGRSAQRIRPWVTRIVGPGLRVEAPLRVAPQACHGARHREHA